MSVEAMTAVPIFVLGDKRRMELVERLRARVQTWLRTWESPGIDRQVDIDVIEISKQDFGNAAAELAITGSIGSIPHLALTFNRSALGHVLGLPRGVGSETAFGCVCGPLRDEVLADLVHALLANIQTGAWLIGDAIPLDSKAVMSEEFRRGWVASISIDGVEFAKVMLSANLVAWLQPYDTKPSGVSLSRRRGAIVEESIQVQAVLGEATVSIGDLAQLAVDDVIVLEADISQPGSLITGADLRVANFSPGKVNGKRAALLVR